MEFAAESLHRAGAPPARVAAMQRTMARLARRAGNGTLTLRGYSAAYRSYSEQAQRARDHGDLRAAGQARRLAIQMADATGDLDWQVAARSEFAGSSEQLAAHYTANGQTARAAQALMDAGAARAESATLWVEYNRREDSDPRFFSVVDRLHRAGRDAPYRVSLHSMTEHARPEYAAAVELLRRAGQTFAAAGDHAATEGAYERARTVHAEEARVLGVP
jgi:hypothetical protein